MADHESELELELEQVFHEDELEDEAGEAEFGAIGNILGGLLGEEEGEDELEDEGEAEDEYEYEDEAGEAEFGAIGNILGSLLGEAEMEDETEEFFGKIGSFLKKAAPMLKKVAQVAAPLAGTAIGGPLGGMLGKAAASALGEEEGEAEDEYEEEYEEEAESEMVHEISSQPLTHNTALAEIMSEAASLASHEGEAEAMSGAATVTAISPADRRKLRRILPHLVRGVSILTRILRKRRATRPLVRAVPTIVRRTVRDLKRKAGKGHRITRRTAGRSASRQIRRVLGSPKASTAALVRNVRVSRAYKRPRRRLRRRFR